MPSGCFKGNNLMKNFTSESGKSKTGVSTPIAVGALALLLILVVTFAWKSSAPPADIGPNAQVPTAQDTANNAILTQLANKTQGHFNLLSPGEQNEVNQMTHGHGQQAIGVMYKGNK